MTSPDLKERLVTHIVLMVQVDANYARHAVKQYLSIEGFPYPDLANAVKERMDLLGITPEPRQPTPWYLQPPDNQGWRLKPEQ